MKWAASLLAYKINGNDVTIHNPICFVEATSEHEAYGKAMLITHKLFPKNQNFQDHAATVRSVNDDAVEPDNACLHTSKTR